MMIYVNILAAYRDWETIRYYVICEYGSQSFRPHYHILLFHDSPRARADFRIVRTLPQSTKENPREICVKLDLAHLWVYGDTSTKVTDGHMQEYVSKYLTQHSDFPRVLDKFPQRSFHSILLGSKDRYEVRELLKARDFETLTTDYVVNKKGIRRSVPMSRYVLTLNLPLNLQALPVLMLQRLLPFFVRWYTLPDVSSLPKEKSMMMDM